MGYYTVEKELLGATAYIIAGGPSVATQNLQPLLEKRVLLLNSSYEKFPTAEFLIFGDVRWWNEHKNKPAFIGFKGKVFGASRVALENPKRPFFRLRKCAPPPGLAERPDGVIMNRTVLHAGINLLYHMGAQRIILLGADMGRGPKGETHHHSPHKWKNKPGNQSWDRQMEQLKMAVEPLQKHGIEVLNATPGSRLTFWPSIDLEKAYANY